MLQRDLLNRKLRFLRSTNIKSLIIVGRSEHVSLEREEYFFEKKMIAIETAFIKK